MIAENQVTGVEKVLVNILREMWDDDEFITGTRLYLKNDEDRKWMIEAIEEKEVSTPSDVALYSVQLYEERQEEKNKYQVKCACCGKNGIEEEGISDVCIYCGWEEDFVQEKYPDFSGGANHMSLNEARAAYKAGKEVY